ncbi:MAG: ABC transporter permease [Chloroflexi bacterium]|nr:ABC transporter permease [Chloroflexota bacterium]
MVSPTQAQTQARTIARPAQRRQPRATSRRLRVTATQLTAAVGVTLVTLLILIAVFAPFIAPYDPAERVGRPFSPPSAEHALGTNDIGHDILSELIFGARISLAVGLTAGLITVVIGTTVGLLAGYFPRLGSILMRFTDVVLVLPFLPLLIILAAYLGRSLMNTVLIIGLLIWASTARLIRSQVMVISSQDFVLAARSLGATHRHIIIRHVLPQVMLLSIGEFVQVVGQAILLEASLSFLGLGDPLQKSWGTVLYWAQVRGAFLSPAWAWWVLPPGLLIGLATLGFALIGFTLEQRFNPRLRQR